MSREGSPLEEFWTLSHEAAFARVAALAFVISGLADVLGYLLPQPDANVPAFALWPTGLLAMVGGLCLWRWPQIWTNHSVRRLYVFLSALLVTLIQGLSQGHSWAGEFFFPLLLISALALTPLETTLLVGLAGLAIFLPVVNDIQLLRPAVIRFLLYVAMATASHALWRRLSQSESERRELSGIAAATQALAARRPDDALEAAVRALLDLMDPDAFFVYITDFSDNTLVPTRVYIRPGTMDAATAETFRHLRPTLGQGLTGWVAEHGEPVLSNDLDHDERAVEIPGTPSEEVSAIFAPLKVSDQVLGVLRVSRMGKDRFTQEDLRLVQLFATHVAVALDNAKWSERLEQAALTDHLTGAYNARYLAQRFDEEAARCRRKGNSMGLLLLDTDSGVAGYSGLKVINDTHGHDAGDALICHVANILRQTLRESDLLVRYAGDEFVVLLPDTDGEAAMRVAERCRLNLMAAPLLIAAQSLATTVSVGVAVYPYDGTNLDELFKAADRALYRAKSLGKNRVVAASSLSQ